TNILATENTRGANSTSTSKTWTAVGPVWEGLSPAYWQTSQSSSNWTTPYTTGSLFNTVFGVTQESASLTLQGALERTGNGINALAREAVAALLNAANPNINYFYTTAQVKDLVQAAYANSSLVDSTTNLLMAENEQGAHLGIGSGSIPGGGTPYG